jgi:hypothetical protein
MSRKEERLRMRGQRLPAIRTRMKVGLKKRKEEGR